MVVVLDPETKPFNFSTITVSILDSNDTVFGSPKTIERSSDFSIYSGNFKLPDDLNMGKWKINIQVNNDTKTTSKHFFVSEISKTELQVYMEVPSVVSYLDRDIILTVFLQDKFKKFVNGTVEVSAELYSPSRRRLSSKQKRLNVNGQQNKLTFSLRNDLNIRNVLGDMTVEFKSTHLGHSSSKSVVIKPIGRHYIELQFSKKFIPGMVYKYAVNVFRIDGTLEDKQEMMVKSRVSFSNDPNHLYSESRVLKKGKAEFNVTTNADSETMTLKVDITDYSVTETIQAYETDVRVLLVSTDLNR